jgi:hypothetical protein
LLRSGDEKPAAAAETKVERSQSRKSWPLPAR